MFTVNFRKCLICSAAFSQHQHLWLANLPSYKRSTGRNIVPKILILISQNEDRESHSRLTCFKKDCFITTSFDSRRKEKKKALPYPWQGRMCYPRYHLLLGRVRSSSFLKTKDTFISIFHPLNQFWHICGLLNTATFPVKCGTQNTSNGFILTSFDGNARARKITWTWCRFFLLWW